MSAKTLRIAFLVAVLFNHAIMVSECSRDIPRMKYHPKELPIKTITIDDGDVYDCMKLDTDPSARDLPIKRRGQTTVNFSRDGTAMTTSSSSHKLTIDKLRETRVIESGSCPPGSVPVLKATKAGPLNLSAIDDFASARAKIFLKSNSTEPLRDTSAAHEYALGFVRGTYGGGEGTFSVWEPDLEVNNEMSLSQIWVLNEHSSNGIRMALEAGWMANPTVFGDSRTRFFIFTTPDTYRTYLYNDNLRKPRSGNNLQYRRSQNARYMPFGKRLQPSTFEGGISEIKITIKKKDDNEGWEILVDDVNIGYWPNSNYGVSLANKVQWGGEIVNRRITGMHTSTEMGSGRFSTEPVGQVAYIRQLSLYNANHELYDAPEDMDVRVDNPGCYDLTYWSYDNSEHDDDDHRDDDNEFHQFITFGGPGYDAVKCP